MAICPLAYLRLLWRGLKQLKSECISNFTKQFFPAFAFYCQIFLLMPECAKPIDSVGFLERENGAVMPDVRGKRVLNFFGNTNEQLLIY